MDLSGIDFVVFIGYCLLVVGLGLFVSRKKKGVEETSSDYFLASRSLPWWAVGASLIASNISAEQFIGMSGSGYAIGLGIATYEWIGAIGLLIVAKYFLPIFLKTKIYTMPQFLEIRYDHRVRTSLAVFWLLVYVFINLTSVLYLGALVLVNVLSVELLPAVIGLALFSAIYSVYGGLKAVAWTDVMQVTFLVIGGLITTFLVLSEIGNGEGVIAGFGNMLKQAPDKFDMVLAKDHPMHTYLPGIGILLGGIWMANLYYFGCNQYIIQRALAAKSLKEAQRGVVFAGFLKLMLPILVVVPGIAAYVLHADIAKPDDAYPWLLSNFVGPGFKGLVFAALIAAIVSSLSSMTNSSSTIFTMDLFKPLINKKASEKTLVRTGRITSLVVLTIAVTIAPLLRSLDQAFQFIQDFTGYVTPGLVAIFLAGLFWKKATSNAALLVAILTIPLSLLFDLLIPDMPFMNRVGYSFLILSAILVGYSLLENRKKGDHGKGIEIEKGLFKTGPIFNGSAILILGILAALYSVFW
ncbi:MAG: sodium/solute symporter [Bacteroidetes bacterium]|nr:sodium/solute symporter [Bacteroidota bacterium]